MPVDGSSTGGGSSSSDSSVPYIVRTGDTFTVPVDKQALFHDLITLEAGAGPVTVNGRLIRV